MTQITGILASPSQTFTIADPNGGGPISVTLKLRPRIRSWFVDIAFGDLEIKGIRLVVSTNVLYQYVNRVPFGLAVVSTDGVDPMLVNDFKSGRVFLYLLTSAEREGIETDIINGDLLA